MSNHISLSPKYLANWVNPASWNSPRTPNPDNIPINQRVYKGNIWALGALSSVALLLGESEKRFILFELEMTSYSSSNIKVKNQCLLMDDKVWIHIYTQISAYTCHYGDKGHMITPSQTEETYSLAPQQHTARLSCWTCITCILQASATCC